MISLARDAGRGAFGTWFLSGQNSFLGFGAAFLKWLQVIFSSLSLSWQVSPERWKNGARAKKQRYDSSGAAMAVRGKGPLLHNLPLKDEKERK